MTMLARLEEASPKRRTTRCALRATALVGAWALAADSLSACKGDDLNEMHAMPPIELTPTQAQEIAATVAHSRERVVQLDKPWRTASQPLVDPLTAPDVPCRALAWSIVRLRSHPTTSDWGPWEVTHPFDMDDLSAFTRTPFPVTFLKEDQPTPELSPAASAQLAVLRSLEDGGHRFETFEARKELAAQATLADIDVLIRVNRFVKPHTSGQHMFTPGELDVSAWAFDHRKNEVVCAGAFGAANSPMVSPGSSTLNDDLLVNLIRALPVGLRETK